MIKKTSRLIKVLSIVLLFNICVGEIVTASEVNSLKNKKDEAQQQVQELQDQLAELLIATDEAEEAMIAKGEEVIAEQEKLADMEALKEHQYEQMKLRIKYMYENGKDASIMMQMLAMDDISEALNKYEYAEQISRYDREQLDAYVTNIAQIEETLAGLVIEKQELEKLQVEYTAKQEEINTLISSKEKEVADLDKKIEAAVAKAAEEAKKKAAAKAAAQAAAAAANGSGSTTGSQTSIETTTPAASTGSATGNQIVSTAMQFVGTPYTSGGASPSTGFDCSGFTSYIHAQFGISVPRSSSAQRSGGVGVSLSDIQPGDIICYSGHVAIYIGNGQIVHATVPGDVVKVASMYYYSGVSILAIRRYY